jgi:hypothetical protein
MRPAPLMEDAGSDVSTPYCAAVGGMNCISPCAPFPLRAFGLPALSVSIMFDSRLGGRLFSVVACSSIGA